MSQWWHWGRNCVWQVFFFFSNFSTTIWQSQSVYTAIGGVWRGSSSPIISMHLLSPLHIFHSWPILDLSTGSTMASSPQWLDSYHMRLYWRLCVQPSMFFFFSDSLWVGGQFHSKHFVLYVQMLHWTARMHLLRIMCWKFTSSVELH